MILSSSREYARAQQARRGERRLDPMFDGFVRGFADRFGFAPLWLETDHVQRRDGGLPTPRLDVVLERGAQARRFHTSSGMYDERKQRVVADLFAGALAGVDLRPVFGLPRSAPETYPTVGDLFVCFSEFERLALQDVHATVTEEEYARFTSSVALELGERFWLVKRAGGVPIVFVRTAEQAEQLAASPAREQWADRWFSLASGHDEFGYLRRENVVVGVDSKETFDTTFSGNWYWYFK